MKKSVGVRQKRRGRPPTGHDPASAIRSVHIGMDKKTPDRKCAMVWTCRKAQPPCVKMDGCRDPRRSEGLLSLGYRASTFSEGGISVSMSVIPVLTVPPDDNKVF